LSLKEAKFKMDKAEVSKKKEAINDLDFTKNLTFEEEIYKYSVEDYNNLLDAKPWRKEFDFLNEKIH
jgi:hypothetical protein